jgi:hypothetical protein
VVAAALAACELAPAPGAATYADTVAPPRVAPPAPVAMSWEAGGAFVWHTTHVNPVVLGAQMRRAGFGWVAVLLADGEREEPLDREWLRRFRAASGLPVGGWTVLREAPEREARVAARLVHAFDLDFHVANAEREYAYTNDGAWSAERYGRSSRFVRAFRRAKPRLPAALSSYCRPDQHDLDWGAWRAGGFAFLPQAYVNEFGASARPAMCAAAASAFFAASEIHPTVGAWTGLHGRVAPWRYAKLLAAAGTTGFSVYLADNGMNAARWRAYGVAMSQQPIAR